MTRHPASPCKRDDRRLLSRWCFSGETIMESAQSVLREKGVSVARGIVRLKQRKSDVVITHFTEECRQLNKDASIALFEEIHGESDVIAVADFQGESAETLVLIAST